MPAGGSFMLGAHVLSESLFYVWRSCVIGNFVLCLDVLCNRKLCFMFGGLVLAVSLSYIWSLCIRGKFILYLELMY